MGLCYIVFGTDVYVYLRMYLCMYIPRMYILCMQISEVKFNTGVNYPSIHTYIFLKNGSTEVMIKGNIRSASFPWFFFSYCPRLIWEIVLYHCISYHFTLYHSTIACRRVSQSLGVASACHMHGFLY